MPALKKVGVIVAGHLQPINGFKEGLQELGWIEGSNVSSELRIGQLACNPFTVGFVVTLIQTSCLRSSLTMTKA